MATGSTYSAKDYMMYGTGWGKLLYNGEQIDRVKMINDSGQPPLGSAVTVQDISQVRPVAIITPLAITKGTLDLEVYILNTENFFESIFNGRFGDVEDLAALFRQQLIEGPMQFQYDILDAETNTVRSIVYDNLTVVSALRSFTIDAQSGQEQATCKVTCEYTRTIPIAASAN